MFRGRLRAVSSALVVSGAILVGGAPAAAQAAAVPNPAVRGPIEGGVRGYPWNHSLFALSG